MPELDPEPCTCSALRQAARRVSRWYDDALAPVNVGINQFSILARLDRLGRCTIQDLAASLVMDRSTLGHLLRPLEARDLLTLRPSERDRRSRVLELTGGGRALLAEARPLWASAQLTFERTFGPPATRDMRTTLKRVEALDLGPSRPSTETAAR